MIEKTWDPQLEMFLKSLENTYKKQGHSGKLLGSHIKYLRLPNVDYGYPTSFLASLFRCHVPQLERFYIPKAQDIGDRLGEAIAEG